MGATFLFPPSMCQGPKLDIGLSKCIYPLASMGIIFLLVSSNNSLDVILEPISRTCILEMFSPQPVTQCSVPVLFFFFPICNETENHGYHRAESSLFLFLSQEMWAASTRATLCMQHLAKSEIPQRLPSSLPRAGTAHLAEHTETRGFLLVGTARHCQGQTQHLLLMTQREQGQGACGNFPFKVSPTL